MPGRRNNSRNSKKKWMTEPERQMKSSGTTSLKDSGMPLSIRTVDLKLTRSYANSSKEKVLMTFSPNSSSFHMKLVFP